MSSAFCQGDQTDGFKKTFESSMGLLHIVDKAHDVRKMPECLKITPGGASTADNHLPKLDIVDGSSPTTPHNTSHFHVGHLLAHDTTGSSPTAPHHASHFHAGDFAAHDATGMSAGASPTTSLDASHFHVGHFAPHDPTGMSIVSQFFKLILDMFSAIPGSAEQLVQSQIQDVAGYVAALDKLKKI